MFDRENEVALLGLLGEDGLVVKGLVFDRRGEVFGQAAWGKK